jgi:hypothetical protein
MTLNDLRQKIDGLIDEAGLVSPPPARDCTPEVKLPAKSHERSNHAPTPDAG